METLTVTTPPSVEDFEAKKGFIEQQKQFNQDAIVNGLGNGTLKVGSDGWYALQTNPMEVLFRLQDSLCSQKKKI